MKSKILIKNNATISVPGDKSISHRSVLFSSLAEGDSEIDGFLEAEDPLNTMHCFSQLGVKFIKKSPGNYLVKSPGKHGLRANNQELDFGNAGTGIRLSAGLLCGLKGLDVLLTGDESLRKRPMKRIIDPLTSMGAEISSVNNDGRAPLRVKGRNLNNFKYNSPIASAQIKSAMMLAAISSDVELDYEEEILSRDHTENMIKFLGGNIEYISKTRFKLKPPFHFSGAKYNIPGDISSASFFIVLGLLVDAGTLLIRNIGLNPARMGILRVLQRMGGNIEIENQKTACGELIGDLRLFPSVLTKIKIPKEEIPSIIDEIPILTIAGLFTKGGFEINHAEELRAKESDRIHAMVKNLQAMGVDVTEKEDGYSFNEVMKLHSAKIETFMDHRIAMSFLILSSLTGLQLEIEDTKWIDTSFPGFIKILAEIIE